MKTDFTEQEKDFFKRQKDDNSKLKIIAFAIVFLLGLGILLDALNGFNILKEAKSISWGIGGLLVLAIFYIIAESVGEWISSKDHVSHPLYKRVFHLLLLLICARIVGVLTYYTFTYLD